MRPSLESSSSLPSEWYRLYPDKADHGYRFFGSGVILATSLIHLLEPAADDEIGSANKISLSGCISDSWNDYPYAIRALLQVEIWVPVFM